MLRTSGSSVSVVRLCPLIRLVNVVNEYVVLSVQLPARPDPPTSFLTCHDLPPPIYATPSPLTSDTDMHDILMISLICLSDFSSSFNYTVVHLYGHSRSLIEP